MWNLVRVNYSQGLWARAMVLSCEGIYETKECMDASQPQRKEQSR